MLPNRLSYVMVYVSDMDRSVAFYAQHLGFTPGHQQPPAFAVVSLDDVSILLRSCISSASRATASPSCGTSASRCRPSRSIRTECSEECAEVGDFSEKQMTLKCAAQIIFTAAATCADAHTDNAVHHIHVAIAPCGK